MRNEAATPVASSQPRAADGAHPPAPSPAAAQPDASELPRRGDRSPHAAEAAVQADAARARRLAELQAQIRDGSYTVDNAALARVLLKRE